MPDMSLMSTSMIYTHVLNSAPAASRTLLTAPSTVATEADGRRSVNIPGLGIPRRQGRVVGRSARRVSHHLRSGSHPNRATLREAQLRQCYAVLGNYKLGRPVMSDGR
jgi:hypothetical protein